MHRDDDRPSFAFVTAPSSTALAGFTAEVPIVAGDPWLASADLARAVLDAPSALDAWRIDAVSAWVDDEDHDDPRCIAPLGNPAQGELL